MVTLNTAPSTAAAAAVAAAIQAAGAGDLGAAGPAVATLEVWRRGGAGQSYAHVSTHELPGLLQEAAAAADVFACDLALIPDEAQPTACHLQLLTAAALAAAAGSPSGAHELRLLEFLLSSAGERRASLAPRPAATDAAVRVPRLADVPDAAQASAFRLVSTHRASGPAVAYRATAAAAGVGVGSSGFIAGMVGVRAAALGGEAWALRDAAGHASSALIGKAGGPRDASALLDAAISPGLPDAKLFGAGGDHEGCLLLFSHQVVRVGAEPQRRPLGHAATLLGASSPDAFVRRLRAAFEQFVDFQQTGWAGARACA